MILKSLLLERNGKIGWMSMPKFNSVKEGVKKGGKTVDLNKR